MRTCPAEAPRGARPVVEAVPQAARQPAPRIKPLTSLRFFAALMVLAHHYLGFDAGFSGVTFFYVLSGYVLALNYSDRASSGSEVRLFWWKRFARIYPTHLLTLLITLPLWAGPFALLLNVSLLQSWAPDPKIYFSFNAPAWSISNEAAFYAVFPCLLILARPRFLIPWGLVLVALALALPDMKFLFYTFPVTRVFEFVIGMFLARSSGPRLGWLAEIAAIALAAACVSAFYLGLPTNLSWALLYIPGAVAMIHVFSRSSGPIARLLSLPVLVLLGDASFMLYMIHFPLHAVIHIDPLLLSVIAIGGSVLLHLGFERPAQRLLLRVYRPEGLPRSGRSAGDADPSQFAAG